MKDDPGSLKKLAPVLNNLPRTDVETDGLAGPPFELPYSLRIPDRPRDCWLLHSDLLQTVVGLATAAGEKDPSRKTDADKIVKTAKDRLQKVKEFAQSAS